MFELTEILNTKNIKTATQDDIESAISRMFITASGHFNNFWGHELNKKEQDILINLAYNKPLSKKYETAFKSLDRKEVIYKEQDNYTFCIPVVKDWIVENGY